MSPDDERIAAALRRLAGHLEVETGEPPPVEPSRPVIGRVAAIALVAAAAVGTVAVIAKPRPQRDPAVGDERDGDKRDINGVRHLAAGSQQRPERQRPPMSHCPGQSSTCRAVRRIWSHGPSPGGAPYHPYAHRTLDRAAVQIFRRQASGSIGDPYVVVLRFFPGESPATNSSVGDIIGGPVGADVNGKGGGEVSWLLSDGSEAYVRDHLFDETQLLEMRPRPGAPTR